jgi:hypothetical protein
MRDSGLRDNFLMKYFRWSLQDCEREVDSRFALLRTINQPLTRIFLQCVESKQVDAQRVLARGLVKRFHQKAVELLGESCDAQETEALHDWDGVRDARLMASGVGGRKGLSRRGTGRIKPAWVREILSDRLAGICGQGREWDREQWRYERGFDGWLIGTNVDLSGGRGEVTYSHSIGKPDEAQKLREGVALLSWLGICGETSWRVLDETDVLPASNGLAASCERFFEAVPELLNGI